MPLSIDELTRIATEAARDLSPQLHVSGVNLSGGSGYSEVLVTIHGCRAEPCQISVGVFRDVAETTLRQDLVAALRRHLADHVF